MRNRILVVDDNRELREGFADWFSEHGTIGASSAAEALEILKKPNELDLVIMDVHMPGMDGLAALSKIKEIAPEKSVIMMTGYSTKEVVIKALRAKADGYIEKPFDLKEIRELIEKELAIRSKEGAMADMDGAAKIKHVMSFIERNALKKITLRDAAAAVGLCPKYLSRIFRAHAGCGFTDYKLKVKIRQAKDMLKNSGHSVKRISAEIGYANTESFTRQFKKVSGGTPSQYRRSGTHKPLRGLDPSIRRTA